MFHLLLSLSAGAQQNLSDYDNSLKFARYLKSTQQYTFSTEEYERMNFIWPGDSSIVLELVQSYRLNNQCNKLETCFELLKKNIFQDNSLTSSREYLSFALTCKTETDRFLEITPLLQRSERCFYELSYFWITQKFDSAFKYNKVNGEILKTSNNDLFQLTEKYRNEKYKRPALALMMSAVVPGSGKAYSKRFGDGLISFLFVGTNAYASYRAFNKGGIKSANGWIFGGLAFGFYTGNLWGSAKSAKIFNSNLRKRYQINAENIIYSSF